jgi:CRP/FNR family cyclic AMP-dependent transcriptional regulator
MDPEVVRLLDGPGFTPGVRALAARGAVRRYRKDTLLIQEGDHGDTLFIVVQGRVKAFSMDIRGREVTFGVYGPGEYLGEMSLDGGPRSASVITLDPSTCIVVVTRQTLLGHIAEHPEFALELLSRVIGRARLATQSARNLALIDVYGRLVQLLNSLAQTRDDGTQVIAARLTHQDIASRVGCSREMVSRLLKDLETGGYVISEGRQLVLLKALPLRW